MSGNLLVGILMSGILLVGILLSSIPLDGILLVVILQDINGPLKFESPVWNKKYPTKEYHKLNTIWLNNRQKNTFSQILTNRIPAIRIIPK